MVDGQKIIIRSDFGKYNIDNHDTIFSKNVIIDYADNQTRGDYVDFSLKRNSSKKMKVTISTTDSLMINQKGDLYVDSETKIKINEIKVNFLAKKSRDHSFQRKLSFSILKGTDFFSDLGLSN